MSYLSERRLTRYTLEQINKQRLAAGATPVGIVGDNVSQGALDSGNYVQSGTSQTSADTLAAAQTTSRQASLAGNYPTATMNQQTGGYKTLEEAQKAQQDHYTQFGSSDPAIDAYIYNLQAGASTTPNQRTTTASGTTYNQPGTIDTKSLTLGKLPNGSEIGETPLEFSQRVAAAEAKNTQVMQQNLLKQQSKATQDKLVAGADTSAMDATKSQLDELMASVKGLTPDLQAAVLPQLLQLQQSNNDITQQVNDMAGQYQTDAELDASGNAQEDYAKETSSKYEAILAKNFETQKEIAEFNKDMLELDKKILDHDAAIAEQKQMAMNVDSEKKLRRQLNRLGIQTDVSALTFLQTEIQKGASALEDLKKGNNLISLKAQLAIGEGYRLEVKQAMETYEGNYLDIRTQTQDKLKEIANSISTAKADRRKGIIEAKKWGLEQKQENDKEARKAISDANIKMLDLAQQNKVLTNTQENQKRQDAYQLFNFAFGSSTDPNLRQAAVNAMNKAGYSLPNDIDMNALPLSMLQKAKDAESTKLTDPFRFKDPEQRQIMSDSYQAVSSLPVALQGPMLEQVAQLLDNGDVKGANAKLQSVALSSLNDTQRAEFADRQVIINSVETLDKALSALEKSGRGLYKQKLESAKAIANKSQDPEYLAVSAQIENLAAGVIKEKYGANVTGPEWKRAKQYIPLSSDTVLDAIGKLRKLKEVVQDKQTEIINAKLGKFTTSSSFDSNLQYDDASMQQIILPTGSSAMRTDRHNNPTAMTTTLARQAGLTEGVDFVEGDPFPNNPKLTTARFLGDPIAQTIKVIDTIGFFTQKGQQRWTHTAIPQKEWAAMTPAQKKSVIRQMYQREGGTALASLFSQSA